MFVPCVHHSGKKAELAKIHLNQIKELLSTIDPNLSDLANNAKPDIPSKKQDQNTPSKRKGGEQLDGTILHVPKKKNAQKYDRNHGLTLSQREDGAMKELMEHVMECGGKI